MRFLPTLLAAAGGFLLAPKLVPKTRGIEEEQTLAEKEAERERKKANDLYFLSQQLEAEAVAVSNSYGAMESKVSQMEALVRQSETSLTTIQNRIGFYEDALSSGGSSFRMYEESLSRAEAMVRLYINTYLAHRPFPQDFDVEGLVEYLVCNSEKDLDTLFGGGPGATAYVALRYNGDFATFDLTQGWR